MDFDLYNFGYTWLQAATAGGNWGMEIFATATLPTWSTHLGYL